MRPICTSHKRLYDVQSVPCPDARQGVEAARGADLAATPPGAEGNAQRSDNPRRRAEPAQQRRRPRGDRPWHRRAGRSSTQRGVHLLPRQGCGAGGTRRTTPQRGQPRRAHRPDPPLAAPSPVAGRRVQNPPAVPPRSGEPAAQRPHGRPQRPALGERLLDVFAEAGLEPDDAARASYLLTTYILGSIALEAAELEHSAPPPPEDQRVATRLAGFAAVPPDRYPRTAATATTMARYITTEQFIWGLTRVLDGLTAHGSASLPDGCGTDEPAAGQPPRP